MDKEDLIQFWVEEARKDIQKVIKSVQKYIDIMKLHRIDIVGVYLFGSYAKGRATENSDIDLAIVTKKFPGDEFDFTLSLMKLARDIDEDIEPHPFLLEDFTESNPFVYEIIKTSKRLY